MATTKEAEQTAPTTADLVIPSRLADGHAIIRRNVYWSMGASLLPFPVWDLAGIGIVQLKMLNELSKLYGVRFSENAAKSIIAALLGSLGSLGLGAGVVASVVKVVPPLAGISGLLGVGATAGAATYAIGRVFVQHFESGGTFLDFDPQRTRAFFAQEFKEGQKVAAEARHPART